MRTGILIAVLLLLAFVTFTSGCLSGSSVPGPATAVVPPSIVTDVPAGSGIDAAGDPVPGSETLAADDIQAASLPADRRT
ncbi:hypothetical protein FGU65_06585 [Methanoculleus sp. FWC-SCC1]|uniref:Uncharacterized protein n=1 Tax=Methanoculleus frigidifontis TaxID=2584085 RepID=A0ABT8M9F0_9EURY|nr:hypothetical protein [Methanoculleus sp. FWC-SCC1]MDN7024555.1 hypothetical protein [Methanoculleus sp. FWC-SCC1]